MKARAFAFEAACVFFAWAALLLGEHLVIAIGYKAYIAGSWEIMAMRRAVLPIALASLVPAALLVPLLGRLVFAADRAPRARAAVAVLAAACAAAVGYGVTFGRHFARLPLRAAFVVALAAVAFLAARTLAPRLALARPARAALALVGVAVLAWLADAFVLPRLYPAFHVALFATTLLAIGLAAVAPRAAPRGAIVVPTALFAAALAVFCVAWSPRAARRLRGQSNLRILLAERAPLLGRALLVASRLAPPDDDPDATTAASLGPKDFEIPRALDWTGRDVVLLSVDALRADHVSAYGYGRATTPSFDALAKQGMLFEDAYCPTPHTSYSVTSMMTGKYMRPLLALGLGEDSETWATALRRYDFRTAAFYPPAVFFIDEARFPRFEREELGFEYAKVEFASADLRATQIGAYLASAPKDHPLFLWVHLFEPHEPYEMHPEHPMGDPAAPTDVDAYDSEIAAADEGIGRIVAAVRAERPGAVVIATADHGEEFGDHGGRYHGTTVYEEQVRVPLVVVGPGVPAGARTKTVAQTIDLFPTVLSALGIPRPARVRGRDLGPVLARKTPENDRGFAFAETDDYALVATGDDRLVCARQAGACALFDVASDRGERRDLSASRDARELRAALRAVERDTGTFETAGGPAWPEALRRGMQGEADAAPEVASLLDDADVAIRRKAAEVLYELRSPEASQELARALARDEDETVRRWCALALVRAPSGEDAGAPEGSAAWASAAALVKDSDAAWRRPAALALAERGDARGGDELAAWWAAEAPPKGAMEEKRAKELLAAMARARVRAAVGPLVASLGDVRLRPRIAEALGAIGDRAAAPALLAAFAEERYVTSRPPEARALVALGVKSELAAPLARFAGLPEPMRESVAIAQAAGVLTPKTGGWTAPASAPPPATLDVTVTAPASPDARPLRLLVLTARAGGALEAPASESPTTDALHVVELGARPAGAPLSLHLAEPSGIVALWVVPRSDELPPPPPEPWPRP